MKTRFLFCALPLTVSAGVRDSADFSLTVETGAPGQPRRSSVRFKADIAEDSLAGIAQSKGAAGQPVFTLKLGYVAQLYDAAGLAISEALLGRLSGIALPKFIVDTPGGMGKVPLVPSYVVARAEGLTTLRTHRGVTVDYVDPPLSP